MYTIGEDNIRGEDWVHKTIRSVMYLFVIVSILSLFLHFSGGNLELFQHCGIFCFPFYHIVVFLHFGQLYNLMCSL